MSTQSQTQLIANAPAGTMPPEVNGFHVSDRLRDCAAKLREHVRGPLVSRWLKDNYSLLQSQITDLRHTLRPSLLRKLPKNAAGEPRIHQIAAGWLAEIAAEWLATAPGVVDSDVLMPFAHALREQHSLEMVELWAFAPMLKLATIERLCANLEIERVVAGCIRTVWAMEAISWKAFVETASRAEAVLRKDPAGVYPRMDFQTRDRYRLELKRLAHRAKLTEEEVATAALRSAEQARANANIDTRTHHVGYYLIGPGARDFSLSIGAKAFVLTGLIETHPNLSYAAGVTILTGLLCAGFAWMAGPLPWWTLAFLVVPASQAALEIINAAISRLLDPRLIPCMDFADAIPADCKTMVVVPTLLLSEAGSKKLIKDLEIRYLANRDPNLIFALLTDFSDADGPQTDGDAVLTSCSEGIRELNKRYGSEERGPFYLLHRARGWNPQERKWMGYERKRGKLNDLNKLLLGRGNWFDTIIGDMPGLDGIRFVITLDTDTQLPRDTAAKMVAAMAHPLNRPILDPVTNAVTEGYALLRPQVAISVESAHRSWIARIFSGQPGFDPYSTSVSDVYHDLHGQASFTGKGIYDVRAFDAAVGERFPRERHPQPRSDRRRARSHRPHQCRSGGRLPGHLRRVFETQTPLGPGRLAAASVVVRSSARSERPRRKESPFGPVALEDPGQPAPQLARNLGALAISFGLAGRRAPGPLDCRGTSAVAASRLRGHVAEHHSRARAAFLESVQQNAGRPFPRKPPRHTDQPGLYSASSLPDGRRYRPHPMARIRQRRELARMGDHGPIRARSRSPFRDFRTVPLHLSTDVAAFPLSRQSAPDHRCADWRSLGYRPVGGWLAQRSVADGRGHAAQRSRLSARDRPSHLAILRG